MLWKSFLSFSKVRAGSRKAARWTQHMQHPLGAPKQAHGTGCCVGKEPLLKEQDMKHKVCFTPGQCGSCTQTRSIRGTPVVPVFSQTNSQQWLCPCQWWVQGFHSQLQICSLREIPVPEKAPSRPGCGPGCLDSPAPVLHSIPPQTSTTGPGGFPPAFSLTFPRHLHV